MKQGFHDPVTTDGEMDFRPEPLAGNVPVFLEL
jgi:hypothetical protein